MNMIETLKRFNKEACDLDEMMALSATAKLLAAEYATHSVSVPEWLSATMTSLGHEITSKTRDQLEKRKRELKSALTGLESAAERRDRITKELSEIDSKLGFSTTTVV